MSSITIIEEYLSDRNRKYSIASGTSCSFGSFEWYVTDLTGGTSRPSTDNIYVTTSPLLNGFVVSVVVFQFTETYWNGGEFYGGDFSGNFGGGTFHYGQLNDCFYLKQEIKPKPFIEDINKPTGPQSVKPVNTSRLV
jgi:hypothetical protein